MSATMDQLFFNPPPVDNRGKWGWHEDRALFAAVEAHGEAWAQVARLVQGRTRKQCRDRWQVHTQPSNHSPLSLTEQVRPPTQ